MHKLVEVGQAFHHHFSMGDYPMNVRSAIVMVLWVGLGLIHPSAHAGMYVFGDSLSDAGNVFASSSADPNLTPDPIVPPYSEGRMSNGPNWTDQLADRLGMSRPTASLTGGTNYAWAGATSGQGQTLRSSLVIPGQTQYVDNVGQQIQTFSSTHPGGFAADALVIDWAGSNDVLYGTLAVLRGQTTIAAAVAGILAYTRDNLLALENLGARTILLPDQIDAADTPIWNGLYGLPVAGQPVVRAMTAIFNAGLRDLVAELEARLDFDARIVLVDMYETAKDLIAHPEEFGFSNVTDPAFPNNIPAAGSSLFWDPIHPTTKGHGVIAEAAYLALIPEPGTGSLIVVGLGLVGWMTRRRRTARAPRR